MTLMQGEDKVAAKHRHAAGAINRNKHPSLTNEITAIRTPPQWLVRLPLIVNTQYGTPYLDQNFSMHNSELDKASKRDDR